MAYDFRANQIRLNRIISSGSTPILIYPSSSASDLSGGQTAEFITSSVGTDVFLFVSGATDGTGKTLFGGDAVVSGNVRIDQSLAQGNSVVASGLYSHAQGFATNATNFYTHAEGISTNATGFYSHAEGNTTTASGIAAHAEGLGSLASGLYSHAEGDSATASGNYSHAEGSGSVASGNYAHAEGNATLAAGDYSHAEGLFTVTNDSGSHAEGSGATTYGIASHAEGFATTTLGDYSHAEGLFTVTYGSGSHAEGNFAVAYGEASHAEGGGTTAFGSASHAEGGGTTAFGAYSHAQGYGSQTFGTGSFAAGLYTVASGAVDGANPPTTTQAAFGKYNLRDNIVSLFVVGDGLDDSNRHDVLRVNSGSVQITGSLIASTITGSLSGTVAGNPFIVAGSNITANYNSLGQWEITGSGGGGGSNLWLELDASTIYTTSSIRVAGLSASFGAIITGSVLQGTGGIATGQYSHSEGYEADVTGNYGHAEGYQTDVTGIAGHAEGNSTTAAGDYSHAEGINTDANGNYSHAEGRETLATGEGSHAAGRETQANGDYSHTIGTGSIAAGNYSFAAGNKTEAFADYQTAVGKFNVTSNSDSLFVVGDGLDVSNRHDILRVNSGSVQVTGSFEANGGITGSLSGTVAGNPFIVAGSNITTNYNSLGQWEITGSGGGGGGGTQKQFVAKYEETTSTTPVAIGQFSWIPSDYASLTTLRVRAIMSTDGTANHTGSLEIYNLTSGSYVNLIDTPSVSSVFQITSSTPTLVTSSNLLAGGTNFDNVVDSIYEVRISGSTVNTIVIGGVELVYS